MPSATSADAMVCDAYCFGAAGIFAVMSAQPSPHDRVSFYCRPVVSCLRSAIFVLCASCSYSLVGARRAVGLRARAASLGGVAIDPTLLAAKHGTCIRLFRLWSVNRIFCIRDSSSRRRLRKARSTDKQQRHHVSSLVIAHLRRLRDPRHVLKFLRHACKEAAARPILRREHADAAAARGFDRQCRTG